MMFKTVAIDFAESLWPLCRSTHKKNAHQHSENIQTPHWKAPTGFQNPIAVSWQY